MSEKLPPIPPTVSIPSWLLLALFGGAFGGSGLLGMLTREGDLSSLQPMIQQAVAQEHEKDQARLDELLRELGALRAEVRELRSEVRGLSR